MGMLETLLRKLGRARRDSHLESADPLAPHRAGIPWRAHDGRPLPLAAPRSITPPPATAGPAPSGLAGDPLSLEHSDWFMSSGEDFAVSFHTVTPGPMPGSGSRPRTQQEFDELGDRIDAELAADEIDAALAAEEAEWERALVRARKSHARVEMTAVESPVARVRTELPERATAARAAADRTSRAASPDVAGSDHEPSNPPVPFLGSPHYERPYGVEPSDAVPQILSYDRYTGTDEDLLASTAEAAALETGKYRKPGNAAPSRPTATRAPVRRPLGQNSSPTRKRLATGTAAPPSGRARRSPVAMLNATTSPAPGERTRRDLPSAPRTPRQPQSTLPLWRLPGTGRVQAPGPEHDRAIDEDEFADTMDEPVAKYLARRDGDPSPAGDSCADLLGDETLDDPIPDPTPDHLRGAHPSAEKTTLHSASTARLASRSRQVFDNDPTTRPLRQVTLSGPGLASGPARRPRRPPTQPPPIPTDARRRRAATTQPHGSPQLPDGAALREPRRPRTVRPSDRSRPRRMASSLPADPRLSEITRPGAANPIDLMRSQPTRKQRVNTEVSVPRTPALIARPLDPPPSEAGSRDDDDLRMTPGRSFPRSLSQAKRDATSRRTQREALAKIIALAKPRAKAPSSASGSDADQAATGSN